MQKNQFLLLKKFKNAESAQLCVRVRKLRKALRYIGLIGAVCS